jgi:hypothetical protein
MFRYWLHLVFVTACLHSGFATGQTEITSLSQNRDTVGRYEKFELTFTLSETYDNPFDPEIVDVSATFTGPDARTTVVFAFFYMDYDIVSGNYANGPPLSWASMRSPRLQ